MKRFLSFVVFSAALASLARGADPRYSLTEYSMNGCPACVAALKDVAALTEAGVDVRCVNTDVDQEAGREARRLNLQLRPAWRLATSDGKEVARWFGAGKSSLILATIRARFPQESETAPEEVDPMKEPEEEPTPPEPELAAPVPESEPPSLLEQIDAELGTPIEPLTEKEENPVKSADFRERKPVYERFSDPGFLDKSLDEWNRRDEESDDSEEEAPGVEEEEEEEEEEGARLFQRRRNAPDSRQEQEPEPDPLRNAALGDRIADRAAARILLGLEDKCDELKDAALRKLDEIGKGAQDALVEEFQRQIGDVRGELEPKLTDETERVRAEVVREVVKGFSRLSAFCAGMILFCSGLSTFVMLIAIRKAA